MKKDSWVFFETSVIFHKHKETKCDKITIDRLAMRGFTPRAQGEEACGITYEELIAASPGLLEVTRHMPAHIRQNFTVKRFAARSIIHQKDAVLQSFGIVCQGRHRVINEFENGNIFMIEKNSAISFIGEVTLLAGYNTSSVTIETITECLVMFISLADFEAWISQDNHFLRILAQSISRKLYSSSYSRGERQYYSVRYLVLKYLLAQTGEKLAKSGGSAVVRQTRQQMSEEIGITQKTLNRTVTSLREGGLLDIQKGKIAVSAAQHAKMEAAARQYVKQSKRGAQHEVE